GVIAMDAGWLGGAEDPPPTPVSVSRSATPACGETGSCANGTKRDATPATSRARTSTRPPSKAPDSGADNGSGNRQSQADLARKARDGYAPRPPSAPGIDQDELDRQRDETESTVAPVPADNGSNPSP
ncbi:hypothetical protein, partial [Actinomadura sp. HBU206391]|uniref:hypothetical protein n=1 Tax=Actinomadura sp. HBU206391 TaxID=2731692 RepID=UPI001C9CAAF9